MDQTDTPTPKLARLRTLAERLDWMARNATSYRPLEQTAHSVADELRQIAAETEAPGPQSVSVRQEMGTVEAGSTIVGYTSR